MKQHQAFKVSALLILELSLPITTAAYPSALYQSSSHTYHKHKIFRRSEIEAIPTWDNTEPRLLNAATHFNYRRTPGHGDENSPKKPAVPSSSASDAGSDASTAIYTPGDNSKLVDPSLPHQRMSLLREADMYAETEIGKKVPVDMNSNEVKKIREDAIKARPQPPKTQQGLESRPRPNQDQNHLEIQAFRQEAADYAEKYLAYIIANEIHSHFLITIKRLESGGWWQLKHELVDSLSLDTFNNLKGQLEQLELNLRQEIKDLKLAYLEMAALRKYKEDAAKTAFGGSRQPERNRSQKDWAATIQLKKPTLEALDIPLEADKASKFAQSEKEAREVMFGILKDVGQGYAAAIERSEQAFRKIVHEVGSAASEYRVEHLGKVLEKLWENVVKKNGRAVRWARMLKDELKVV